MAPVTPQGTAMVRTPQLDASFERALGYARECGHARVTTEHVLLALTDDAETLALLHACGVDDGRLRTELAGHIGRLPPDPNGTPVHSDTQLTRVIETAGAAGQRSQQPVNSALLLAAMIGDGQSPAADFLNGQGLTFDNAIRVLHGRPAQTLATQGLAAPSPNAGNVGGAGSAGVLNGHGAGVGVSRPAQTNGAAGLPQAVAPSTDVAPPQGHADQTGSVGAALTPAHPRGAPQAVPADVPHAPPSGLPQRGPAPAAASGPGTIPGPSPGTPPGSGQAPGLAPEPAGSAAPHQQDLASASQRPQQTEPQPPERTHAHIPQRLESADEILAKVRQRIRSGRPNAAAEAPQTAPQAPTDAPPLAGPPPGRAGQSLAPNAPQLGPSHAAFDPSVDGVGQPVPPATQEPAGERPQPGFAGVVPPPEPSTVQEVAPRLPPSLAPSSAPGGAPEAQATQAPVPATHPASALLPTPSPSSEPAPSLSPGSGSGAVPEAAGSPATTGSAPPADAFPAFDPSLAPPASAPLPSGTLPLPPAPTALTPEALARLQRSAETPGAAADTPRALPTPPPQLQAQPQPQLPPQPQLQPQHVPLEGGEGQPGSAPDMSLAAPAPGPAGGHPPSPQVPLPPANVGAPAGAGGPANPGGGGSPGLAPSPFDVPLQPANIHYGAPATPPAQQALPTPAQPYPQAHQAQPAAPGAGPGGSAQARAPHPQNPQAPSMGAPQGAAPTAAPTRANVPAALPPPPLEMRDLAKAIPRSLRANRPALTEISVPRATLEAIHPPQEARAEGEHTIAVAFAALELRLRAIDGDVVIQPVSPEAQWSRAAPGAMHDDTVSWRWALFPSKPGQATLQLTASIKALQPSGRPADIDLPMQVVDLRIARDYGRLALTLGGLALAAVVGAGVALVASGGLQTLLTKVGL
ncbi:MAG: Clp protease N-terminal domain-containing protein [Pseudomonadota bacterium]